MDFRDELNQIQNGSENEDSYLEKHVDFFLRGVCHALRQHKYIFNDILRKDIFIAHDGARVYAKYTEKHETELFELYNINKAKEIFDMLVKRLKSQGFKVEEQTDHSLITRLYN